MTRPNSKETVPGPKRALLIYPVVPSRAGPYAAKTSSRRAIIACHDRMSAVL